MLLIPGYCASSASAAIDCPYIEIDRTSEPLNAKATDSFSNEEIEVGFLIEFTAGKG